MPEIWWLLLIVVPVGFALIVGLIVLVGRPRPEPALGPAPDRLGQQASSGVWNVMLMDGPMRALGGTIGSTTGRFAITDGYLTFTADQASEPEWGVACRDIAVATSGGLFGQLGAGVTLSLPSGQIRCIVSRERINKFMSNDLKTMRQVSYFEEFARTLAANGARYA